MEGGLLARRVAMSKEKAQKERRRRRGKVVETQAVQAVLVLPGEGT